MARLAGVPDRPAIAVIDVPGAEQAAISVMKPGLTRRDARFYNALVANAVLGGSFSARLGKEIRIKRGLAYVAGSTLEGRYGQGPFVAATQTTSRTVPDALALILGQMSSVGTEAIPPEELAARRAAMHGTFGRQLETTVGIEELVAADLLQGVPADEIDAYLRRIDAVSPDEARASARDVFDPAGATVVVVGNAVDFLGRLQAAHGEVTLIPSHQLNLDSISLR
jgi:zinc protease